MATLLVNGNEISAHGERELSLTSGMTALLTYGGRSICTPPLTLENLTEIHWRFEGGDEVAFESDINQRGRTVLLADLQSVNVQVPGYTHFITLYVPNRQTETEVTNLLAQEIGANPFIVDSLAQRSGQLIDLLATPQQAETICKSGDLIKTIVFDGIALEYNMYAGQFMMRGAEDNQGLIYTGGRWNSTQWVPVAVY